MKWYLYEVEGRGRFPIDMLRYDCSSPERGVDANNIEHSLERARTTGDGPFVIQLRGPNAPEADRWRSFGWTVRKVEKR